MIFGLRAPLSNRTNGNAYYYVVTNLAAFLPATLWTNVPVHGILGPFQMNLGGLGFRSLKWCPQLAGGQGRYLILAGNANGGPLQREKERQKFAVYSWTGDRAAAPTLLVADLQGYGVRPEGIDLIYVNGQWRVLFVEDRFTGTGYATRNAIHWPLSILGTIN